MLFTTTTPSEVMMNPAVPVRLNCGSPSWSKTSSGTQMKIPGLISRIS